MDDCDFYKRIVTVSCPVMRLVGWGGTLIGCGTKCQRHMLQRSDELWLRH